MFVPFRSRVLVLVFHFCAPPTPKSLKKERKRKKKKKIVADRYRGRQVVPTQTQDHHSSSAAKAAKCAIPVITCDLFVFPIRPSFHHPHHNSFPPPHHTSSIYSRPQPLVQSGQGSGSLLSLPQLRASLRAGALVPELSRSDETPPPPCCQIMALEVQPPSDRKRVKVYELRDNDWFDRGTGFCTGQILDVSFIAWGIVQRDIGRRAQTLQVALFSNIHPGR